MGLLRAGLAVVLFVVLQSAVEGDNAANRVGLNGLRGLFETLHQSRSLKTSGLGSGEVGPVKDEFLETKSKWTGDYGETVTFILENELGIGGFGDVWLARTERVLPSKVLPAILPGKVALKAVSRMRSAVGELVANDYIARKCPARFVVKYYDFFIPHTSRDDEELKLRPGLELEATESQLGRMCKSWESKENPECFKAIYDRLKFDKSYKRRRDGAEKRLTTPPASKESPLYISVYDVCQRSSLDTHQHELSGFVDDDGSKLLKFVSLMVEALEGVLCFSTNHLMHNDIKPGNIFICGTDSAVPSGSEGQGEGEGSSSDILPSMVRSSSVSQSSTGASSTTVLPSMIDDMPTKPPLLRNRNDSFSSQMNYQAKLGDLGLSQIVSEETISTVQNWNDRSTGKNLGSRKTLRVPVSGKSTSSGGDELLVAYKHILKEFSNPRGTVEYYAPETLLLKIIRLCDGDITDAPHIGCKSSEVDAEPTKISRSVLIRNFDRLQEQSRQNPFVLGESAQDYVDIVMYPEPLLYAKDIWGIGMIMHNFLFPFASKGHKLDDLFQRKFITTPKEGAFVSWIKKWNEGHYGDVSFHDKEYKEMYWWHKKEVPKMWLSVNNRLKALVQKMLVFEPLHRISPVDALRELTGIVNELEEVVSVGISLSSNPSRGYAPESLMSGSTPSEVAASTIVGTTRTDFLGAGETSSLTPDIHFTPTKEDSGYF